MRDSLVRGLIKPRLSINSYDWLGKRMFFFEGDPGCALNLTKFANANPAYVLTQHPIVLLSLPWYAFCKKVVIYLARVAAGYQGLPAMRSR